MNAALGLRGKLLAGLGLIFLLALGLAVALGWHATAGAREHFGERFAANLTLLSKQRIFAPVARELALSERLANSVVTRRFLLDEHDGERRARFFEEAEGYRRDFADHSYFLISANSLGYYFNDDKSAPSREARYRIDPAKPEDAWYTATMRNTVDYNLNVDHDVPLKLTKIWINVIARDGDRKLGIAGTGIDLTRFLADFTGAAEPGVTPMVIDAQGAIQAHPDSRRIAFTSGVGLSATSGRNLFDLLAPDAAAPARAAMTRAVAEPDRVQFLSAVFDGRPQLIGLSYLPELKWYVLTAVDLRAAQVIDPRLLLPAVLAGIIGTLVLVLGAVFGVNRLVIAPLLRLTASAQSVAAGDYALALPAAGGDEIGALTTAFAHMTDKVRSHTEELERTVQARTADLVAANEEMRAVSAKVRASIDYASLLQRALLPDRRLAADFAGRHCLLWRPRDVVGGDLYFLRQVDGGQIFGVIDCAGHGVPGAFMTMLALAALDRASRAGSGGDPAGMLRQMDAAIRSLVPRETQGLTISTQMDAAIVWLAPDARQARYAGARLPLFLERDGVVSEIKGGRRALGDRRSGEYLTETIDLAPGTCLYLSTDGLLDQAGGEYGYSFGVARFRALLAALAGVPAEQRAARILQAFDDYRGAHPQRDDVTIFGINV